MITYTILFKGLSLLDIFCDAKLHLAILPILRSFPFLCLSLKKSFEWLRYPQIQKYGKYNMDTNESIPQVEINKRIIQRYFEAYNNKNEAIFDEIISPRFGTKVVDNRSVIDAL